MGPNLFMRNENSAYVCSDIMRASRGVHTQASQPPYVYMACQEILMDMPFVQAE